MLKFEDALSLTLSRTLDLEQEPVTLSNAVNRVLATDLYADISMPPFDKSAMDGFACRMEDLDKELEQVEVIQAGVEPQKEILSGQCAQIMTGAMLPKGADTVIMVEHTELSENGRIRFVGDQKKSNICYLGEDIKSGDKVLSAGTLIGTRHIPILASIGAQEFQVLCQPAISVLATGTELVEPDQKPKGSQIRNSNASQMMAQVAEMGLKGLYFGIAPDNEQETFDLLKKALDSSDILLLSGGVSMGEFDFVPLVIERLGFKILYQKIAVQPGKPTTFAIGHGKAIFALPGNPISSFIQFELIVKPYIYKCMSYNWNPPVLKLHAGERIKRKKTSRMSWFPVRINQEGKVVPMEYHGSAHIFAISNAHGFASFEIGQAVIEEGDILNVRPI